MVKFKIILSVIIVGIVSCKDNTYHVYSPDKNQCITFIEDDFTRYIINGYTLSIPDSNYVKLDIRNTPEFGDEVAGCWKTNEYDWKLIVDEAKILENKLDSSKFVFLNKLPLDKDSIPSVEGFNESGCYHFGTYYLTVRPNGGAIIE